MTILVHADSEQRPRVDERPQPEPLGTSKANVTLHAEDERILRITLHPGSQINAADAMAVRERYLAITGGAGRAILLEVTGVGHVSRGAVRIFSEAATVTAFAILGTTAVDRVIAHGRRGLPAPQCPSRYFTNEKDALAWLNSVTAPAVEGLS